MLSVPAIACDAMNLSDTVLGGLLCTADDDAIQELTE